MSEERNGEIYGKRLPDGSYELTAYADGTQITKAFIHKQGIALFETPALYFDWAELLSARAVSDDTLIYPVGDIDRFIEAVGMESLDPKG